ncbi:tape measure domain-containing protein [Dialister histaminiformans]|uniref:Tape measure domain-containing protein n=1 Tax=Allisonella histaminiformans TaxID=209880 RepID=A0A1G5VKZ0_9FIRM|nr:tape measure protein [Allisonella histaminiformans]SDA45735.1 tape measure domain-containing protein [Allisonella histaminiformans]
MAGIVETIELHDGMSPVLRQITNQVDSTSNSFSEMKEQVENTAESGGRLKTAFNSMGSVLKSVTGQFALANIAAAAAMKAADFISQIPGKLAKASDEYAGIQARLQMVVGSAQAASDMNDRIFASAMRARGSYEGMLSNVSKIAMTAKEAFPDPKQVVPFVEGIQKLFTIGGTGVEEQKNAMLQLTQALGSGRLQGDEFRSIAEAAPMIEQMIAKEMGVTQGKLKELSSKGLITADVIKDAIFNNMDEINQKFSQMPMTFGQIAQQINNVLQRAFAPALQEISQIANSEGMKSFASVAAQGLMIVGSALSGIISGLSALGSMVMDVGSYIGEWLSAGFVVAESALETFAPVLFTVMGAYLGYQAAIATGWAIANVPAYIHAGIVTLVAAKTAIMAAVTSAWTAVTKGATVAQAMLNVVLSLNPLGIVIGLVVAAIGVWAAWRSSTVGLKQTVAEAFRAIANIVQDSVNIMISAVNGLIKVLNVAAGGINTVFGTHIGKIDEIGHVSGWGDSAYNFVQNDGWKNLIPKFSMPTPQAVGAGAGSGYGNMPDNIQDMADSGRKTADNTQKIADSVDTLDEDLKYLRDIAEREVINKYTTAQVTVEMGGVTNQISNETDIDGIVDSLTLGIQRGMENAAKEVHI